MATTKPAPAAPSVSAPGSQPSGIQPNSGTSLRTSISRPEAARPTPSTIAARRALRHSASSEPVRLGGSSTITVSAAAVPSGNGSFSSTMKCRRIGTASSTPSSEAQVSQTNTCSGVGSRWNETIFEVRSMSNEASTPHMKAVCAPEVPAVCTMLFWKRS